MTGIRRYVFGLLAVCTAFAVGLALGGGPLQGHFGNSRAQQVTSGTSANTAASALHREQQLSAAITAEASHRLLAGRLAGRTVTLVVLSGVARSTVSGLLAAVEDAGGLAPVVVRLSADLVDPTKKVYVDSVAANSARNRPDLNGASSADTYERIGAVLARAYVGHAGSATFDAEASGLDAELQGARLVTLGDAPVRRGDLVIVVLPRSGISGQYAEAVRVISQRLVTALAAAADGAVMLSSAPTADETVTQGWPRRLRTEVRLSTLSGGSGQASRIAAVYALVAAAGGTPGDFGVVGDGLRLPPGLAEPGS